MRWIAALLFAASLVVGCTGASPTEHDSLELYGPEPGLEMRPEFMSVDPSEARPADTVVVTFAAPWDRGILYALDRRDGAEWDREYLIRSGPHGGGQSWSRPGDADFVVEAIGVGGDGPDRVVMPEVAEPGSYRLCTANAVDDVCTPIEMVAP